MSTLTKQRLSREAVEELSQRKGEPAWMRALRLLAWETFEALPLPTTRDEEWRRTDIRAITLEDLRLADSSGTTDLPAEWLPAADALQTRQGILVQRNATPAYRSVADSLAASGVILTDMDSALREYPDLVRKHFMAEAVKPGYSKFAALNGAC